MNIEMFVTEKQNELIESMEIFLKANKQEVLNLIFSRGCLSLWNEFNYHDSKTQEKDDKEYFTAMTAFRLLKTDLQKNKEQLDKVKSMSQEQFYFLSGKKCGIDEVIDILDDMLGNKLVNRN